MSSSNDQPFSDRAEQSLADLAVSEAKELIAGRECHEGRNDLMALLLHQSGCRKGGEYDPELVNGCLKRLRVLAETGCYPQEMLREREEKLRESASN